MIRLLAIVLLTFVPAAARAQRTPREVTVDISALGASVGWAIQSSPGRLFGVQAGGGLDFFNRTIVGGRHFKDNGGDNMYEIVHLAAFHRSHVSRRFSLDVGLRISGFIHGTDADDDVSPAAFAGMYVMPMFGIGGGQRFSVGPRILAGALTEGADRTEFGVNVTPLVGRVTFGR